MITEFFIDCFFGISEGFFKLLPDITWSIDTGPWEYIRDILSMVAYLLPMDAVGVIVATVFALACVRIVISLIRMVRSFIPYV